MFQRPAARLSPCPKTNPRSRARQEADVKPRFLTGAAPNLALLFADDAATAESILARKRGRFFCLPHPLAPLENELVVGLGDAWWIQG